MPAYVVAVLNIHDPEAFGRYAGQVGAITEKFGGRYLWAGPGVDAREGEANAMAIIEFPTAEAAQGWYDSAEYAPLIAERQAAAATTLIITPDASS